MQKHIIFAIGTIIGSDVGIINDNNLLFANMNITYLCILFYFFFCRYFNFQFLIHPPNFFSSKSSMMVYCIIHAIHDTLTDLKIF